MKKTSKYARKRAHQVFVSTSVDDYMARRRAYDGNTLYDPTTHLLRVHTAFSGLLNRTAPSDDTRCHDDIAHAIGEAEVRYIEIAGRDNNPALAILVKAGKALYRARQRWERTGQWGLDGPAIQELKDAIAAYEQVLLMSSPQQMHDAAMTRWRWIELQNKDKKLRERMEQRYKEEMEA